MLDDNTLIFLALACILGSIGAIAWVKTIKYKVNTGSLDPETVKKTLSIKDKYIRELEAENEGLEKEVRSWTGKYHGLKKGPKIDKPEGEINDLDSFVEANLPDFARQLPPEIGKLLLSNKEAVKAYVKANPAILNQFTKAAPVQGSAPTQSTPIEDQIRSRAV